MLITRYFFLSKSNLVKHKTSGTLILPPTMNFLVPFFPLIDISMKKMAEGFRTQNLSIRGLLPIPPDQGTLDNDSLSYSALKMKS